MSDFDVRIEKGEYLGKPVAIVRLPGRYRVLSSTIMGGGFAETDTLFILEVKMGYDNCRPEDDLEEVRRRYALPADSVGFMTAAHVAKVLTVKREEFNGKKAIAVVTAGVTNAVYAGERLPQEVIDLLPKHVAGTINIIAVIDQPIQDCGMAGGFITVTEAKSAALRDMGCRVSAAVGPVFCACRREYSQYGSCGCHTEAQTDAVSKGDYETCQRGLAATRAQA